MRRLAAAVLSLAALLAASLSFADAPSTMSYQGVLTNDDGTLVADGNYNLTFRLYDVAVAGAALHTENFPAVAVERGGFSVILGSLTPLPVIFDRQIYLGVQVAADPELAPRVPLASSPYAMGLRFPVVQTQSLASSMLDIRNTLGLTATLHGRSRIGSENHSGRLDLIQAGAATPMSQWYTTAAGANLDFFDEGFDGTLFLQADGSGSGGFINVRRNTTSNGFVVDGNRAGTGDTHVSILGASRSATFDMSAAGNASVLLPTDAIAAAEMFDEPGVAAANINSPGTSLDGTVQSLLTRSITVPASGWCLVIGSLEVQAGHSNPVSDIAIFGVSDAPGAFPATQDNGFIVPGALPTGNYHFPTTVHGMFQVNAGVNTFYLLADENSGSVTVGDVSLSIVYIPTQYGLVTSTLTSEDGSAMRVGAPLTGVDEVREAEAFHRARVDREMAAMQAQMDELRRQLERVESEQASVARKEK
jgi:hypothetical protein